MDAQELLQLFIDIDLAIVLVLHLHLTLLLQLFFLLFKLLALYLPELVQTLI